MNRQKIAGIDYSLTSPAVCIYTEESDGGHFDFDSCVLHYLSHTKGQQQLAAGCGLNNIKATPYPEWKTTEERHENLSDWTYKLIQGCKEVFIEGYAYGVTSNRAPIYENTAILKHKMWKYKVPFTIFPPSVIKKYATGKGNADKELMYKAFCDELLTPPDLKERLSPKAKKVTNPISDIVDSYFIVKCGIDGVIG